MEMMIFFSLLTDAMVYANLPTLDGFTGWAQSEGGNAVTIVLVGFAVFYLIRQSWGKLIGFVVIAALVFFIVGDPEGMLSNIQGFWEMMTGSGA